MAEFFPEETGKCPHCNAAIEGTFKNVYIYGSPIRTCKKCKKQYLNRHFHEIAIDGIRPEDLSAKNNGKMILGTLISSIFFGTATVFTYSSGRMFALSLILALASVFFFFGMILDTIKVKTGKKAKEFEKKGQESRQRLQNKEYALTLARLGYPVPGEYLVDAAAPQTHS